MEAHIERRGHDRIDAVPEHAVTVRTNHVVTDTHALRAVDALVWIAQDEAVRHVDVVVVIVVRLTVMEAVIVQSMLDTVLLPFTLPARRPAALQTTTRFAPILLPHSSHPTHF